MALKANCEIENLGVLDNVYMRIAGVVINNGEPMCSVQVNFYRNAEMRAKGLGAFIYYKQYQIPFDGSFSMEYAYSELKQLSDFITAEDC